MACSRSKHWQDWTRDTPSYVLSLLQCPELCWLLFPNQIVFVCSPAKQRRSYNPDAKIVVTKTLRSGSKCFVSVCYSLRPHVGEDRSGWLHVQKLMEGRKKPETFTRFCMPTFNILLPSLPSRKNRVLVSIKVWNRIKKIQKWAWA